MYHVKAVGEVLADKVHGLAVLVRQQVGVGGAIPSECDDVIRRGARQQKAEGYRIERALMDCVAPLLQSISDLEQILGC